MTAQEMLIKKFTSKLTLCWTTTLSWKKNNNIYIVEQLETVHSYICIHIEPTNLPEGMYKLVSEAEEGPGEAQVNFADAVENPNPTPEVSN